MADQIIVVNPDQQARLQLVEDMKKLKANPLSEAKVPGGVFKDATGDGYHNAHGQAITKDGKPIEADEDDAAKPARARK